MVQLGPDTRLTGWDGCSGYHFSDEIVIYGFSHTHLSGTGVSDYGDILLMPVTGEPHLESGDPDRSDEGYASRFDKATSGPPPATTRCPAGRRHRGRTHGHPRTGLHRYAFPAGPPAHVIVDLEHRDRLLDADLRDRRRPHRRGLPPLVGLGARPGGVFPGPSSPAPSPRPRRSAAGDRRIRTVSPRPSCPSATRAAKLLVQVGISAVDADGARRNLEAEWAEFDFAAAAHAARDAWRRDLAPFALEGADDERPTVLATALYHSFLAPNLFSDADGRYRGMDLAIHQAEGRDQYTVFSLWDTYRATHPLFTLVQRERTRDFVQTMLAQYEQGGRLPVWELAANETDCMIGYHSVSVIADAYLKGLGGGDEDLALRAMLASAGGDRFGLAAYRRDGYIAADQEIGVGQPDPGVRLRRRLHRAFCRIPWVGRRPTVGFEIRAQAWRHLFDPQSRCFRPRHNGRWLQPFDPRRWTSTTPKPTPGSTASPPPTTCASTWPCSGGDAACAAVLDSLFAADSATTGREQADITGLRRPVRPRQRAQPPHRLAVRTSPGEPGRSAERVAADPRRVLHRPRPTA